MSGTVTDPVPPASPVMAPDLRQQVLVLYLGHSGLDGPVLGWSLYDGTGRHQACCGGDAQPPYRDGVAALRDGWRLMQMPPLPIARSEDDPHEIHYPPHEFVFERWERIHA